MTAPPPVRADLVAAMRAKVNAPGYDVDAELADAIEAMLAKPDFPLSQR